MGKKSQTLRNWQNPEPSPCYTFDWRSLAPHQVCSNLHETFGNAVSMDDRLCTVRVSPVASSPLLLGFLPCFTGETMTDADGSWSPHLQPQSVKVSKAQESNLQLIVPFPVAHSGSKPVCLLQWKPVGCSHKDFRWLRATFCLQTKEYKFHVAIQERQLRVKFGCL